MSYTSIFQKTYDLVKWIYPTVNKFPKSQRFVLVQRIENTSFKILEMALELMYKDNKILRKKIIIEIHKLRILLRMSKNLSYLNFKKYEHVSKLLLELRELLDSERTIKDENLQRFV